MMDGGVMAQMRAGTVQLTRQEVYAALQYAASFIAGWKIGNTVKN